MSSVRWEDYKNLMSAGDQQIIIQLVGPDMTGKTEIAKALADKLDIPYFKASTEHNTYLKNKNSFVEQLKYADPRMVDFLSQTGHDVVFDRGFPCEYAYSRVMDRVTDDAALLAIDASYAKLNTKIIVCYRSSYKGIIDDIDKKIDQEILEQLEKEYRNFALTTACDVMFLCVDDENLEREVDEILIWLQQSTLVIPYTKTQCRTIRQDALKELSQIAKEEKDLNRRRFRGRCHACHTTNCGYTKCACGCHS